MQNFNIKPLQLRNINFKTVRFQIGIRNHGTYVSLQTDTVWASSKATYAYVGLSKQTNSSKSELENSNL